MGDVAAGVIQEIKTGDLFVAERGAGFRMSRASGEEIPFLPTVRADLESIFWTLGFRGRPAVILASVLEELIDVSSVGGCVFDIGSATYGVTRILTGQLDAYVDIGPAIIAAHPWTEAEFRRVGRGAVLCNSPYDVAAIYLLCGGGRPAVQRCGRRLARRQACARLGRHLPDGDRRLRQRRAAGRARSTASSAASRAAGTGVSDQGRQTSPTGTRPCSTSVSRTAR